MRERERDGQTSITFSYLSEDPYFHLLKHLELNEVYLPVDSLVVSTRNVEVCVVEHGNRCDQPQYILNAVRGLFPSAFSKGLLYLSLCLLVNVFT